MKELDDEIERLILEKCFHPESFEALISECNINEFVLADVLRTLIRKRWLWALEEEQGEWKRMFLYDKDKLRNYTFETSAQGIQLLTSSK